jgi:hypothetical protein
MTGPLSTRSPSGAGVGPSRTDGQGSSSTAAAASRSGGTVAGGAAASPSRDTQFAELPPRGLQAIGGMVLAPRAPLHFESRLTRPGLASTVPLRGRDDVARAELPLAGYLLARALDGRKVTGKALERLRRADESVRETRALLAYGRGNVKEDNPSNFFEAYTRLVGARNLKDVPPSMSARAIWAGAGYCTEHAQVVVSAHAARLDEDSKETVSLLGNVLIDHGWAESVIPRPGNLSALWKPDEQAIVLDAWKDGPAVFAVDSTRTHAQWLGALALRRVDSPQPELLAEAKSVAQDIALKHDPRNLSAVRPPGWAFSNARSVVSAVFVMRVSAKPAPVKEVLEKLPEGSFDKEHPPVMPADLRKDILAASIARDLMAPPEPLQDTPIGHGRVRSAAKQVEVISNALPGLTDVTARRAIPWIPSAAYRDFAFAGPLAQLVRRPTDAATHFERQQDLAAEVARD